MDRSQGGHEIRLRTKVKPESTILAEVRLALGSLKTTRVFRNQVGLAYVGKPPHLTPVVTGLTPGSGDLIGWHHYEVRPEDVGKKIAVFTSVECKTQDGRMSPKQVNWLIELSKWNAVAGVVRSPEEAVELIQSWQPK
jgi:hypothetical protein